MLGLNWWITDILLNGNFTSYGSDVIKYYSELPENSYVESERSDKVDPMCNAFPTQVNCPVKLEVLQANLQPSMQFVFYHKT